ncbi:MAG: 3-isopropylmalate dehydrogenase [Elusimicrobia bacterium CG1_02_37_114]|nr:MAG: 3-isopropylmalate dehydrogenase [Elusimicrobia bacterium CG1_02_37_114]PIV52911.1 MAG: 3-isopropylmalate dehydrogenase [Elusimicrobia bacterium CG02_land_8_20_14_3_00_37_13]PIZ13260.1 MAG: 3-isopropylmalate dehydrogenase [Elusimicrobia bacterium CG_4_10_14_0_8_um_filter_37_32]
MANKKYRIGVLPGDGVGPECIREGLKVLESACGKTNVKHELVNYDFGGDRYLRTNEILPDSAIEEFKKLDAIYLGAVGHPEVQPGLLEKELLLKIRFKLDQYINLRPVVLYPGVWSPLKDKTPEDIDFVVIRENTEGLYCGIGGVFKKNTKDEIAVQEEVNTYKGVERCIRYAFEYCEKRKSRKKEKEVTMVDKSNVLTYGHDLWMRIFEEVGKEFKDIKKGHAYVDACCMWMVKNPEWFDVIVTNNLFGDIITDLGAITQGGLGVAAGGNINPEGVSMFEPIHGSAPKYTGKNVINPIATIAAGAMMMDILGETATAENIEKAIRKSLSSGKFKSMDAGKMGMSTSEVGDLIAKSI